MLVSGALGFAELTAGHLEQAEASLSRAVDLSDRFGLAEPAAWRFHANHIEMVIGLGDLDRAERLLGRFEGRGRATGRAWTLATAARCRGLLRAARGDPDGAVQALEEALRHHQDLAMPFELGRTLLVMGQAQRRAKRKRAAKEHLDHALEIFESLPSPPWADRARAEVSRLGLRPPAPLELTGTEERVAALAAAGRTNRQVARALFISPKTVEANLARIYRKLGISSRAELGAALARPPPPGPRPDPPPPGRAARAAREYRRGPLFVGWRCCLHGETPDSSPATAALPSPSYAPVMRGGDGSQPWTRSAWSSRSCPAGLARRPGR